MIFTVGETFWKNSESNRSTGVINRAPAPSAAESSFCWLKYLTDMTVRCEIARL